MKMIAASCGLVLVFAAVMRLYFDTLYPSIPGGDAGELVAEACSLGVAHPPGYPLFTLLYHGALRIADALSLDKSPAQVANGFTAILGAMAASVLQLCVVEMIATFRTSNGSQEWEDVVIGVGISLAFAFSRLVWTYSIGVEVFALNNLMIAVLIWLTLKYTNSSTERRRAIWIRLGAFWCGLALCNQHTAILFEIPLISWILVQEHQSGRVDLAKLREWSILFLLGLSLYLYLPISASFNRQPGSWGDPASFGGFVHHVRRGDYGTFRLFSKPKQGDLDMFGRLHLYFEDLQWQQGALLIPAFAFLGAVFMLFPQKFQEKEKRVPKSERTPQALRKDKQKTESNETQRRNVGSALIMTYFFYLIIFHYLANLPMHEELLRGVQARFWMQPNMIVFLFAGAGVSLICEKLSPVVGKFGSLCTALLFAAIFVVIQMKTNRTFLDQTENYYLEEYAHAIMTPIPKDSLLIVSYDQQWTTLRYLQKCERFRLDVAIVSGPMMTYEWQASYEKVTNEAHNCLKVPKGHWVHSSKREEKGGFSTKDLLDLNYDSCKGGIYRAGKIVHPDDTSWKEKHALEHMGLVGKFVKKDAKTPFDKWLTETVEVWQQINKSFKRGLPILSKYPKDTWEWTVRRDTLDNTYADAAIMLESATVNNDTDVVVFAASLLQKGYISDKDGLRPHDLKNLGIAHLHILRKDEKTKRNPVLKGLNDTHVRIVFGKSPGDFERISANILLTTWKEYLETKEGKQDLQRDAMLEILKTVENTLPEIQHRVKDSNKFFAPKPG